MVRQLPEKAGAKASRTSFHSLRPNFRDALRYVKVEKEVAYVLGGWAGDGPDDGSVTAENCGRGFKVATLAEAVAQVGYQMPYVAPSGELVAADQRKVCPIG